MLGEMSDTKMLGAAGLLLLIGLGLFVVQAMVYVVCKLRWKSAAPGDENEEKQTDLEKQ